MEPVISARIAALCTRLESRIPSGDLVSSIRILNGQRTKGGIQEVGVGISRTHIIDVVGERFSDGDLEIHPQLFSDPELDARSAKHGEIDAIVEGAVGVFGQPLPFCGQWEEVDLSSLLIEGEWIDVKNRSAADQIGGEGNLLVRENVYPAGSRQLIDGRGELEVSDSVARIRSRITPLQGPAHQFCREREPIIQGKQGAHAHSCVDALEGEIFVLQFPLVIHAAHHETAEKRLSPDRRKESGQEQGPDQDISKK